MENLIKGYLARGWYLVPLRTNDKMPCISDWVNAASNDWYVVREWLRQWPSMNLGVACGEKSGFFVVDIDKKAGGLESLQKVQTSGRRLPPTLAARTAGGGFHFLYEVTDDFCPRNVKLDKLDRSIPGFETRGQGGQIVIAPSVVNGAAYQWVTSHRIAPPPRWLVELIERPRVAAAQAKPNFQKREVTAKPYRRLEAMADKLSKMPEDSGRNNFLNWAAYTAAQLMKEGQLDEVAIRSRLADAGRASGLDRRAVEATITSALRGAMKGSKT